MIERPVCPCCGAPPERTLTDIAFDDPRMQSFFASYYGGRLDGGRLAGGTYRLERCAACRLIWQRWILDDEGMALLYGSWIDPRESSARRRSPALRLQYARHCARLLRLFPDAPSARLLDYGMGWGEWCAMARAFGFQVHGVDLSAERVEHARARDMSASLPDDLPPGGFDFVHLEQVLEHLPSPSRTLDALVQRIAPGGYIHVGVPNGAGVERAAPGGLLAKGPAQPLEHINIFTPRSLCRVMALQRCRPARQEEMLLRARPLGTFVRDVLLSMARALPASMFPPTTSLLFQKR